MMLRVPYRSQRTSYDCGPAVLQMVARYFDIRVTQRTLERLAQTSQLRGTSHKNLIHTARAHGFYVSTNDHPTFRDFSHMLALDLPVIVDYIDPIDKEGHYVVVLDVTNDSIVIHDPWRGPHLHIPKKEFAQALYDRANHSHHLMIVLSPHALGEPGEQVPLKPVA